MSQNPPKASVADKEAGQGPGTISRHWAVPCIRGGDRGYRVEPNSEQIVVAQPPQRTQPANVQRQPTMLEGPLRNIPAPETMAIFGSQTVGGEDTPSSAQRLGVLHTRFGKVSYTASAIAPKDPYQHPHLASPVDIQSRPTNDISRWDPMNIPQLPYLQRQRGPTLLPEDPVGRGHDSAPREIGRESSDSPLPYLSTSTRAELQEKMVRLEKCLAEVERQLIEAKQCLAEVERQLDMTRQRLADEKGKVAQKHRGPRD